MTTTTPPIGEGCCIVLRVSLGFEVGHDALGEAVHLFEGGGFGHAHAGDADVDFFEAGVVVLDFEEFFGYEVGGAGEESAAGDVGFDGREVGG